MLHPLTLFGYDITMFIGYFFAYLYGFDKFFFWIAVGLVIGPLAVLVWDGD